MKNDDNRSDHPDQNQHPEQKPDAKQNRWQEPTGPEPWPQAVNGCEVADDIAASISRHLILKSGAPEVVALWVMAAHAYNSFDVSPRLAFLSPMPECGKTTALSIVRQLVPRALMTSNVTPAVIFRIIEKCCPTLLIDEADTFFTNNEELRGILNSGHTRAGAIVVRCEGDDYNPRGYSTWAPMVIAKIGSLPSTLHGRSFVIPMQRKRRGERIEPFRPERDNRVAVLGRRSARWAVDHARELANAEPSIPSALRNRAADNAFPLLAVADALGGHWPETARRWLPEFLSDDADDAFLPDVRAALATLPDDGQDFVPSSALAGALSKMEDRTWGQLTAAAIASKLRPYGIAPKAQRKGEDVLRGYKRSEFADVFARYL